MNEEPVLIVGAGPVGMLLACELLQQGVEVRLIDAARINSAHSRATIVWPRLLELLRRTGVTDRIVDEGHLIDGVAYFSRGRRLGTAWMTRLRDTPYPFAVAIAQSETEQILAERLDELGGRVERGTRLTAIDGPRTARPVATLELPDGRREDLGVSWLVGADGAHGAVRDMIGATFEGDEFDVSFAITDAEVVGEAPSNVVSYCYTPQGSLAFGPLGPQVSRVAVSVPHAQDDTPPSREFFQRIVDERGPGTNTLGELRFSATFRVHARIASRFRIGKCLLAGDAAHIMSPAGAQGMNTGLQDAVNLGWRLGAVLRGEQPDDTLDGYDHDRRVAAHAVARTTALQTRWGFARRPAHVLARDTALRAAATTGTLQRTIAPLVAQTSVRYPEPPARGGPGRVRPGDRLPVLPASPTSAGPGEVRIAGTTWVVVAADRPTVLLWPGRTATPGWPELAGRLHTLAAPHAGVVDAPAGPGPLARALGRSPAAVVVRPDGHVRAVLRPDDAIDALPALLGA